MKTVEHSAISGDYYQHSAVSSGMIRCFARQGSWCCYHQFVAKTKLRQDTQAMRFGRAFHRAMEYEGKYQDGVSYEPDAILDGEIRDKCLERGDLNEDHLVPGTPVNKRLKAHRTFLELWSAKVAARGHEIITPDEYAKLEPMCASVFDNAAAMKYQAHADAHREQALAAVCEDTGLNVKALADIHIPSEKTVVDFKTTRCNTPKEFIEDAYRMGYHYQAAHYLDVFQAEKFVIISVKNEPPFEVMVYVVPPRRIEEARDDNMQALRQMAACYAYDSWHTAGFGEEVVLDYDYLMEA